jgi:hypothetical protein
MNGQNTSLRFLISTKNLITISKAGKLKSNKLLKSSGIWIIFYNLNVWNNSTERKYKNIKEYTPQQIRFKEPIAISITELAYPDTLYV